MHRQAFSHIFFHKTFSHSGIHKKRLQSLEACVQSVLSGSDLRVSELGRTLDGSAKVKHKIKRVDRLLSNRHLYREIRGCYQFTVMRWLKGLSRVIIIVDWSPYQHKRDYGFLKASLLINDRAVTLYQKVAIAFQINTL